MEGGMNGRNQKQTPKQPPVHRSASGLLGRKAQILQFSHTYSFFKSQFKHCHCWNTVLIFLYRKSGFPPLYTAPLQHTSDYNIAIIFCILGEMFNHMQK